MPEPIEPHAVSSYLHGNFIPPNPVIPTDPIVPLAQEVSLLVHEFPAAPVVPLGQAVTDYFHPGDPVVPTTTDGWLLY